MPPPTQPSPPTPFTPSPMPPPVNQPPNNPPGGLGFSKNVAADVNIGRFNGGFNAGLHADLNNGASASPQGNNNNGVIQFPQPGTVPVQNSNINNNNPPQPINSGAGLNAGISAGGGVGVNGGAGLNSGINAGLNGGLNSGVNGGINSGLHGGAGLNGGVNSGLNTGLNGGLNSGGNGGAGLNGGAGISGGVGVNGGGQQNAGTGLNAGIAAGGGVNGGGQGGQQTASNNPSGVISFPQPGQAQDVQTRSLPTNSNGPDNNANNNSSNNNNTGITTDNTSSNTNNANSTNFNNVPNNTFAFGIPKSQLFGLNLQLNDPASLVQLQGTKFTLFQIWYLTSQILKKLDDRFRPDYVFMLPPPFQKGIPAVNMSQVLLSPQFPPEILRALIEESPGMLPSQLGTIVQRVRLSEPSSVKSILSSSDPSKLLDLFNPRYMRQNIGTIIKTLSEMPEMGQFGAKSVRAKLLPKNLLSVWLSSVNPGNGWTAADLLGGSLIGAENELQFTILGLSCKDILSLPSGPGILTVLQALKQEINMIRSFQNVDFPMPLRRCGLEKVLEYLKGKAPDTSNSNQNTNNGGSHILDHLSPSEIKAIGGEVLTAIPTSALKSISPDTRKFIIEEIGRLDTVWLISFASIKKLSFYADEIIMGAQSSDQRSNSNAQDFSPFKVNENPSNSSSFNATSNTANNPIPITARAAEDDSAVDSTTSMADNSTSDSTAPVIPATTIVLNVTDTNGTESSAVVDTGNNGTRIRRQTPSNNNNNQNAEKLSVVGNLYCYSTHLGESDWDAEKVKDFLGMKESPGEKTCCMDKISRQQWNKFLKTIYGGNVTSWNEFDLAAMGDLLIALDQDDLDSISLDTLSRVFTALIKKSGLYKLVKSRKVSFAEGCASMLAGSDESTQFQASYKRYMKRLAQSAEFISDQTNTTNPKITCNGLKIAGPAAVGYSIDDLKSMDPNDLFGCIDVVGSVHFDTETKAQILQYFQDNFHLKSQRLSTMALLELGELVEALTDVQGIPLKIPEGLDSIAILGSQIKNTKMLKAVADKLSADNNLSFGAINLLRSANLRTSIISFGNIICGMNEVFLNQMFEGEPTLYLDTSPTLGQIEGCPLNILSVLANHAIRPMNYGPPETWSIADIRTIGVVVAGLPPPQVSTIRPDVMEGLSASAIKSFPSQSVVRLTPAQLSRLAPDVALAFDPNLTSNFSPDQLNAYKGTIAIERDSFIPMGVQINGASSSSSSPSSSLAGFGTDPFENTPANNNNNNNSTTSDPNTPNVSGDSSLNVQGRSTDGQGNNGTSSVNGTSDDGTNTTTFIIPTGQADDLVEIVDLNSVDDSDNTTVLGEEERSVNESSTPDSSQPGHDGPRNPKKSSSSTLIGSSVLASLCIILHSLVIHCV